MKLSIVIPVYNVENTLERCLQSVCQRLIPNFEIILINDGSTDKSLAICKRYASNYVNIRIFNQENHGLSYARNKGIEECFSEYITFIDSDDYIDPETFPSLMTILEKHPEYDILEYPILERKGSTREKEIQFSNNEYHDFKTYWLNCKAYLHSYACNKIYKRKLFNDIRYPVGRNFEDIYILPDLGKKAKVIATTNRGLYYYCWNNKGITATASAKDMEDLLNSHLRVLPIYHDEDYYLHVLNIQLDVYEMTKHTPTLPIYPYKKHPKLKIANLLGINTTCKINYLLHKIYRRH